MLHRYRYGMQLLRRQFSLLLSGVTRPCYHNGLVYKTPRPVARQRAKLSAAADTAASDGVGRDDFERTTESTCPSLLSPKHLKWLVLSGTQFPPPCDFCLTPRGQRMIGQPSHPFVPRGAGYSVHWFSVAQNSPESSCVMAHVWYDPVEIVFHCITSQSRAA